MLYKTHGLPHAPHFFNRNLSIELLTNSAQPTELAISEIIATIAIEETTANALTFLLHLTLETSVFSNFVLEQLIPIIPNVISRFDNSQSQQCWTLIGNLLADSPQSLTPDFCDFLLSSPQTDPRIWYFLVGNEMARGFCGRRILDLLSRTIESAGLAKRIYKYALLAFGKYLESEDREDAVREFLGSGMAWAVVKLFDSSCLKHALWFFRRAVRVCDEIAIQFSDCRVEEKIRDLFDGCDDELKWDVVASGTEFARVIEGFPGHYFDDLDFRGWFVDAPFAAKVAMLDFLRYRCDTMHGSELEGFFPREFLEAIVDLVWHGEPAREAVYHLIGFLMVCGRVKVDFLDRLLDLCGPLFQQIEADAVGESGRLAQMAKELLRVANELLASGRRNN
jgi:hypothetical protein